MMLGRALVANGDVDEGRRLLREGHAAWMAAGAVATGTEYASHAADVLLGAGEPEEAAYYVRAGEKLVRDIGERFFEAELLRHRGQLAEFGVIDEPEATRSDGLSRPPTSPMRTRRPSGSASPNGSTAARSTSPNRSTPSCSRCARRATWRGC
jgi:hypothetical protein